MSVYSEEPPFRAIGAGWGRMGVKCVLGGGRLLHIFCSFFFFFNFFFTQGILIHSQILKCWSVKAKKICEVPKCLSSDPVFCGSAF